MKDSRFSRMLPKGRQRTAIVGFAVLLVAIGTLVAIMNPFGTGNSASTGNAGNSLTDPPLGVLNAMPYCEGTPPPVGLLGRLGSGGTPESLLNAGYKAVPAIDGTESDLVIITPATGGVVSEANAESALAQLRGVPAIRSVGFVLAQSEDPELHSCDYRLSDKPAAVELAARVTSWMVTNGVLTQDQIDAGGTTFQVAEDPTSPEQLFFTVLLATPGGGVPGSQDAGSLTSYVAIIDRASGAVLNAGRAHW